MNAGEPRGQFLHSFVSDNSVTNEVGWGNWQWWPRLGTLCTAEDKPAGHCCPQGPPGSQTASAASSGLPQRPLCSPQRPPPYPQPRPAAVIVTALGPPRSATPAGLGPRASEHAHGALDATRDTCTPSVPGLRCPHPTLRPPRPCPAPALPAPGCGFLWDLSPAQPGARFPRQGLAWGRPDSRARTTGPSSWRARGPGSGRPLPPSAPTRPARPVPCVVPAPKHAVRNLWLPGRRLSSPAELTLQLSCPRGCSARSPQPWVSRPHRRADTWDAWDATPPPGTYTRPSAANSLRRRRLIFLPMTQPQGKQGASFGDKVGPRRTGPSAKPQHTRLCHDHGTSRSERPSYPEGPSPALCTGHRSPSPGS